LEPDNDLDRALELRAAAAALEEDWPDADKAVEDLDDMADRAASVFIPPPPAGVDVVREELAAMGETNIVVAPQHTAKKGAGGRNSPFDAELDAAEIDERDRPGPTWTARARGLSRSGVTFVSRRMCYIGRRVIIAVHLIDEHPTPLFGRVASCEYESEGLYRTEVTLEPVPDKPHVQNWITDRNRN
jgi:hypothetical protein